MNKQWILIAFLIIVFAASIGMGLPGQNLKVISPGPDQVCIEDNCFSVEIAANQSQRQYGLMNREYLDPDKGMLFVFEEEGNYRFWMKNTLMPLDIIWINSSQDIVYIERNAQPCTPDFCPSINPGKNASYVLEINGGLSDKYGINVGNKVSIGYVSSLNSEGNFPINTHPVIYPEFWKFNRSFEFVFGDYLKRKNLL